MLWLSAGASNPVSSVLRTRYAVNLRRHDKVALGQAVDFVSPEGNLRFAPGQQDVRVMSLLLGYRAHPVHEIQCLLEIGEGEGSRDVVLVDHFPVRPIRKLLVNFGQLFASEGRHSASARD